MHTPPPQPKLPAHILRKFDISPFLDLMLRMAQERTVEGLLELSTRVYKGSHVRAGCIWFTEGADTTTPLLRLMIVAGKVHTHPRDWHHSAGTYALLPLTEPLIGIVATTGEAACAPTPNDWERPDWAATEGFMAYTAYPLLFKGQLLGVMGLFYDRPMLGVLGELLDLHRTMHKIFADSLAAAVANARAFEEIQRLRRELELENETLRRQVQRDEASNAVIIGEATSLRTTLARVDMVAPTDATVLITGESGTGKELIAEAIHQRSNRARNPLVRVNCSAIPRELFESEFFGHVKGAFTGAMRDRTGRFQLADGGTLFLDEVGEIPLELQGKLLRVLQEGTFERIGEDRSRSVDVRIITATNRDLRREVAEGRFRQDLFFRLSVFPLELPPLRARKEDIPLLARHFVAASCRRVNLPEPRLTSSFIEALRNQPWPGNVRELQNAIERAVILADGGPLSADLLTAHPVHTAQPAEDQPIIDEHHWRELQRSNIRRALERTDWRVQGPGGAAELLGLRPTTLRSRMETLGIIRTGAHKQG